jgi:hypothetical protein
VKSQLKLTVRCAYNLVTNVADVTKKLMFLLKSFLFVFVPHVVDFTIVNRNTISWLSVN